MDSFGIVYKLNLFLLFLIVIFDSTFTCYFKKHEAVSRNNEDLAILLLDKGAYPNVPAGDANMTPLHEAVACKNIKIASLLVSRGADIYACNSRGKYPRHVDRKLYTNYHIICFVLLFAEILLMRMK